MLDVLSMMMMTNDQQSSSKPAKFFMISSTRRIIKFSFIAWLGQPERQLWHWYIFAYSWNQLNGKMNVM